MHMKVENKYDLSSTWANLEAIYLLHLLQTQHKKSRIQRGPQFNLSQFGSYLFHLIQTQYMQVEYK